jgi:predicted ATP-dependent serine protease
LRNQAVVGRVILLIDVTGAGKTTLLRRVALEIATKRSAKVLVSSSLSRIESQITASLLDMIDDPVLLVVDNIADQANAIADTVERLRIRRVQTHASAQKQVVLSCSNGRGDRRESTLIEHRCCLWF